MVLWQLRIIRLDTAKELFPLQRAHLPNLILAVVFEKNVVADLGITSVANLLGGLNRIGPVKAVACGINKERHIALAFV